SRLRMILLHALIRDQVGEVERVGVQVHVARDARDGTSGTALPHGPVVPGAAGCPGVAAGAAAPGGAGVEVLAVIVGDPGREIDAARLVVLDQVAGSAAGAAINE